MMNKYVMIFSNDSCFRKEYSMTLLEADYFVLATKSNERGLTEVKNIHNAAQLRMIIVDNSLDLESKEILFKNLHENGIQVPLLILDGKEPEEDFGLKLNPAASPRLMKQVGQEKLLQEVDKYMTDNYENHEYQETVAVD